ncbi:MAG: flagellar basal body P-ring protein FlgI [Armatimonadetes bacterium]|nr:flagellar basal body P-ring protein FlgI [Armatimonadota bacterium]
MKLLSIATLLLTASMVFAQAGPPSGSGDTKPTRITDEMSRRMSNMRQAESNGISVRIKDIARFRGIRSNSLMGIGVVVGLKGTGDTRKNPQSAAAIANYMKSMGQSVDPTLIEPKNCALVFVRAELPPFATNGQELDLTVASAGDALSLQGGLLLRTELYAVGDNETVYAIGEGSISIGGYGASSGGSSKSVGFLTAGRVPSGGVVEQGAPTKLVYSGKMYLELMDADLTTANRVQDEINKKYPEFNAMAENGGTIGVSLPTTMSPVQAMSKLEELNVLVDNAAVVVINEKTGAIAIGGNVRIAPVAIASGSISVKIEESTSVSQPNPFAQGTTTPVTNQKVSADQGEADIAVMAPNTTVADLARIFQELRLKSSDIINILQILRQQGALKARLVIQ